MSMTTDGNVYENAVAERINGILKSEYYLDRVHENLREAQAAVSEAIGIYNALRPHESLCYRTPSETYMEHRQAA